jgi:hypothetical protein
MSVVVVREERFRVSRFALFLRVGVASLMAQDEMRKVGMQNAKLETFYPTTDNGQKRNS